RLRSRRTRSIALLRATWVIQAPGLAGTPSRGQRSSAATNASWTASSAASKSRRTRISVATARADSCRKVRSTPLSRSLGAKARALLGALAGAAPDQLLAVDLFAGGADQRPHFQRGALQRHLPRPGERLVEVRALDDPEAHQLLLGLDERPVGDRGRA